jgi:hypothetical protein
MSQWSGEGPPPGEGFGRGGSFGPDDPSRPPPGWDAWQGWAEAGVGAPPNDPRVPDLSALIALVESLRRMIPAELQEQFNALQRELLLTVRGLIDWQLERLEAGKPETPVEEIPID